MNLSINILNNSFGAKQLFPIKLKKTAANGNYSLTPSNFSQLSSMDADDWKAIYKISDNWKTPSGVNNYARNIVLNFQTPRIFTSYFVTEMQDVGKDLYSRIASLMQATNPAFKDKESFEIFYLQSAPQILLSERKPPIKGAGEVAIYGAVKLAKDNGFERVELLSTNDSFYEKLGFDSKSSLSRKKQQACGMYFELTSDKYDSFLKKVEQKYSL